MFKGQGRAMQPKPHETILLVGDNEMVRSMTRTVLESLGYPVLTAESGEAALSLPERHDGPIDLVLTDVVMPGMSGREMIKRIAAQLPEIRTLYMSGYADDVIPAPELLEENVFFIQKPFPIKALSAKVREILDAA
jgi:CheY-like chemotaxis protein